MSFVETFGTTLIGNVDLHVYLLSKSDLKIEYKVLRLKLCLGLIELRCNCF